MIGSLIAATHRRFDPSYVAVLARGTALGYTLPTLSNQVKQNALVIALKNGGTWAKLDALYIFATDGDQNFATINWKTPASFQITRNSSPTFTALQGFTGDGVAASLNTNFNWFVNGTNYVRDSASRGMWVRTAGNITLDGIPGTTANNLNLANVIGQRINCGTTPLAASMNFSGTGLKTINRTSSTVVVGYNNTTSQSSTSGSDISSNNQFILRNNSSFGTSQISLYFLGAQLTSVITPTYNAFNAYMSSL